MPLIIHLRVASRMHEQVSDLSWRTNLLRFKSIVQFFPTFGLRSIKSYVKSTAYSCIEFRCLHFWPYPQSPPDKAEGTAIGSPHLLL